jgi:hypothetical protein
MPSRTRHVPFSQRRIAAWLARFPSLGPRLARWESAVLAEEIAALAPGAPVWICGMARSGSTVLLEMLNGLPSFSAHRYSDYPWLWTPYWWNHLLARLPLRSPARQERAHRDRILVGRDSPEAFEEVFWMHYFPRRHDPHVSQVLGADVDAGEFARFYDQHQRKLLLIRGARRYLAKANYQIPRLRFLHRLYPQGRFVIPVREPLAQVASLMRQDALFARLDQEDAAVSAHLARIGHFEFGPHKRALNLGDAGETRRIAECFARGALAEGYARQWVAQYGHALQRMQADAGLAQACLWLGHERLCANPRGELARLGQHVGLAEAECAALVADGASRLSTSPDSSSAFSADERERLHALTAPLWEELQPWLSRSAVP